MVLVIAPLVNGDDGPSAVARICLYCASLLVSATVAGAAVGAVGAAAASFLPFGHWLLTVGALAYGARELGMVPLPLPSRAWQVPAEWGRFGNFTSATLYGAALGLGWLTRTPFSSYYVMVGSQLVVGSAIVAASLGLAYGFARSLGLFAAVSYARRRSIGAPLTVAHEILRRETPVRILNGLTLGILGGANLVTRLG